MSTPMRRTRFVCVSDTHNATPRDAFKLPKGDVLIHAGDLSKNGTPAEVQAALRWIDRDTDFQVKLVIAGNHDTSLATPPPGILSEFKSITYLIHSSALITLPKPPFTTFSVFASPFSPEPRHLPPSSHSSQKPYDFSAFQYPPTSDPWSAIPLDTDIVVTHTPPKSHCDEGRGCPGLAKALARVRPKLAVCGHVHEGRGAERIEWEIDLGKVRYRARRKWVDVSQGTRKEAKVDLSAKGRDPLGGGKGRRVVGKEWEWMGSEGGGDEILYEDVMGGKESERSDKAETCVVNAAILSKSWPYKKGEGRYNKPIVVDLDLPVVEGHEDNTAE